MTKKKNDSREARLYNLVYDLHNVINEFTDEELRGRAPYIDEDVVENLIYNLRQIYPET